MRIADPAYINNSLLRLRMANASVSGSQGHRFQLNPPLPEQHVLAFERSHQVRLPDDFRHFLINVGNGGAGPYYGIFRLGEMDDLFGTAPWRREHGYVGMLSSPFPHQEGWNDVSLNPKPEQKKLDESEYWKQIDAFEKVYWDASVINGSFPICHQGCALRILLVVTGPQAGYLWDDRRSEYRGLKPVLLADGSQATFVPWYEEWLQGCLAVL